MKNSIHKVFIITLLFCGISIACDVTDLEPVSDVALANFYQNAQHAEAGLFAAYDAAQKFYSRMSRTEYGSDTFDPVADRISGDTEEIAIHAIQVGNGEVQMLWENAYFGMNRINEALKFIPGIEDKSFDKNGFVGELKFIRALFYFHLTQIWGEVPLKTEPTLAVDFDEFGISRSSEALVYEQIIKDLEESIEVLPGAYNNNLETRGRATRAAAQGLLAKVLLTRSYFSFAGSDDLNSVIRLTDKVLSDENGYQLSNAADYLNMFQEGGKNSNESIFEIQYDQNNNESQNWSVAFLPDGNCEGCGGYGLSPSSELSQIFRADDARLSIIDSVKADDIISGGGGFENDRLGDAYPLKYLRFDDAVPNLIVLRLADIYLMRAEAFDELTQTSQAISALNIVRDRAFGVGVYDYPSASLGDSDLGEAIANERFLEFAFEGHRWFDLKRTGELSNTVGIEDCRTLWPIPGRELGANANLSQNDCY